MGRDLSEMSLEELWELFPIFLVAHDDRWKDSFHEIEKTLSGLLSDQPVVRISHIGSTAVQGILAKNIVDVMVEIPSVGEECLLLFVLFPLLLQRHSLTWHKVNSSFNMDLEMTFFMDRRS